MTAVELPPELLSSIFLTIDFEEQESLLVTLSLVCRFWRDVIYSTPQLWARIRIVVPGPDLSQWFTKAGTCPLDVTISGRAWPTATYAIIKLIPTHLHRMRSLRIRSADKTLIYSILRPLSETRMQAPLLEEFALVNRSPADEDELPQILAPVFYKLFNPSPRLRKLTIPDPGIHPNSSIFRHVTHLSIVRALERVPPNFYRLLDTLAAIPGLVSFKYDGLDIYSFGLIDRPPRISLPHLTTLDLTTPSSAFECIAYLDTPMLSTLRLNGARPYRYDMDWFDGDYTPVSETLRSLAGTIVHLELISLRHLNPESFKWILDPTVFPHLQELQITACPIRDFSLDANALGHTLRRLELTSCIDISGRALAAYVERGVVVSESAADGTHLVVRGCPAVSLDDFASLSGNYAVMIEVLF